MASRQQNSGKSSRQIYKELFERLGVLRTSDIKSSRCVIKAISDVIQNTNDAKDFFTIHFGLPLEPDKPLMDYILKHAKKANYDFFGVLAEPNADNICQDMMALLYGLGFDVFVEYYLQRGFPMVKLVDRGNGLESDRRSIIDFYVYTLWRMRNIGGDTEYFMKIGEIFHLYMAVIPDPFVDTEELRSACKDTYSEDDTKIICDSYDKYFNVMARNARRPRGLRHLCRCSIRKYFLRTMDLRGLEEIPLPPRLKEYVNLERLYDEHAL